MISVNQPSYTDVMSGTSFNITFSVDRLPLWPGQCIQIALSFFPSAVLLNNPQPNQPQPRLMLAFDFSPFSSSNEGLVQFCFGDTELEQVVYITVDTEDVANQPRYWSIGWETVQPAADDLSSGAYDYEYIVTRTLDCPVCAYVMTIIDSLILILKRITPSCRAFASIPQRSLTI
jgi:hypothetical protein